MFTILTFYTKRTERITKVTARFNVGKPGAALLCVLHYQVVGLLNTF